MDDIILFCKAKASKLVSLKRCLEKYCSWSRQKISVEKFGFFPFQRCQPSVPQSSKVYLGLCSLLQHTTYLGVPLFLSRSRGQDFSLVKERLENKLSSWKGKNLSWSGGATLIKSVAQVIPIYTMTAFQFPKSLCEQLDATVRRF